MFRFHPEFNEVVLAFAWFAACNLIASLAVLIASRRVADTITADPRRARWLVLMRLAPAGFAALTAGVIFLPAHIALEPPATQEWLGPWTATLGICGMLLVSRSVLTLARTWLTSRRLTRDAARQVRKGRATLIEVPLLPGIALTGIFRPRILIGAPARHLLTSGELDVAMAHELAHQRAGDNLTRLLMLCAPDFLSGTPAARRIERVWSGEAECFADAAAVAGDRKRATRLASALVKIGRLASGGHEWSPHWSTLHHPALLELRVRRLVSGARIGPGSPRWQHAAAAFALAAVIAAWIVGLPTELHWLTERLLHS
jgi:Zn-dependent protease with chaperone function